MCRTRILIDGARFPPFGLAIPDINFAPFLLAWQDSRSIFGTTVGARRCTRGSRETPSRTRSEGPWAAAPLPYCLTTVVCNPSATVVPTSYRKNPESEGPPNLEVVFPAGRAAADFLIVECVSSVLCFWQLFRTSLFSNALAICYTACFILRCTCQTPCCGLPSQLLRM